MSTAPTPDPTARDWLDTNRTSVEASLRRVRGVLQGYLDRTLSGPEPAALDPAVDSSLGIIQALFGLTPFELDVLMLCAGVELDGGLAALCAAAGDDANHPEPSFGLALAAFPDAHWSALTPDGPLRRWRLVALSGASSGSGLLTRAAVRIDERILHFLVGLDAADPLLAGYVVNAPAAAHPLCATHEDLARRLADVWGQPDNAAVVQLVGDSRECTDVAARAAALGGTTLRLIQADDIPDSPGQRDIVRIGIERDTLLGGGPLLISASDDVASASARWFAGLTGPKALIGGEHWELPASVAVRVAAMTGQEQRLMWADRLGARPPDPLGRGVVELADQFRFTARDIEATAMEVKLTGQAAWTCARRQSRHHLTSLATHVESSATWPDLVLPAEGRNLLQQIHAQVRLRHVVMDDWGMRDSGPIRGAGVSALFSGASGTGKTLAAEVLANELDLDLWRIDLSQVVSKYIGETEKNLNRIFSAANQGGCVLLFDEADALFGKRSEVRDSHDRYANLEVSYLLQLMEAYRGLAVLTTNLKDNLDTAFLRRLDFVVAFPFPDQADRKLIWERVLPESLPTRGVRSDALADLAVPGGVIRNIAVGAAFLAADAGDIVTMEYLLMAAQRECAKLERPISATEVGRWR